MLMPACDSAIRNPSTITTLRAVLITMRRKSSESCSIALQDPEDYKARANLMWAAALALNGLTAAGLGKVGFPMHLIER